MCELWSFSVTLCLCSQDEGGLNSTTDLIIRVMDVQDSPPFFTNQPYLGEVSESAAVVSTLHTWFSL